MKKFFLLPDDHFIETGNPRVLFKPDPTKDEQSVLNVIREHRKTILYLPTLRDAETSFDFAETHKSLLPILGKHKALFIQKLHSVYSDTEMNLEEAWYMGLPAAFDVNVIISEVDLVITDYSSVAADAVYYGKPIIYYTPDYEVYSSSDRGFVIDFDKSRCGPRANSLPELQVLVDNCLNDPASYIDEGLYSSIRQMYWGDVSDMDTVWSDIVNRLG